MLKLVLQPKRLFFDTGIAQEFVNVPDARPREHALITHMAEFLLQVAVQAQFEVVIGREIGVSTFGWKRTVDRAVPKHARFAQAGSSGDEGRIACLRDSLIERNKVIFFEVT